MNKKLIAVAAVILITFVALAAIAGTFLAAAPTSEIMYKEPVSVVRAPLGKTATSDTIALRLNGITDGSNPATSALWTKLSDEANYYNMSLTPYPGDRYLIANLTVTNVQRTQVPFSYGAFALLTPNSTAYYAGYAVCGSSCSAQALENETLNAGFSSNLYVLFSVPAGTVTQKVVYTTSDPPIVMLAA
jgi:hypothetical protein